MFYTHGANRAVINSLKSDYPPPKDGGFYPDFASHQEYSRTCISRQSPARTKLCIKDDFEVELTYLIAVNKRNFVFML